MIKEPRYEPKIQKWIVEYGNRAHYFADGETAEDFYLINRARYNETKNPWSKPKAFEGSDRSFILNHGS